jgi:hypothetical protein
MSQNQNENEPFKLTEKLRSEIVEVEPIEEEIEAGSGVRGESERFKNTAVTTKFPLKRNTRKSQARLEPISKFRSELRKHSDARKRTDLAIQGIQTQLKEVLLVHHATIRDLEKQVTQIQRKIKALERSKRSTSSKKLGGIRKSKIKVKKKKPLRKK